MSAIPFDMKTYWGSIRVVPDAEGSDKLIEVQVYLPKRQFADLKTLLEQSGYNESVEISKNRIVRRGRTNHATNVFIDRE